MSMSIQAFFEADGLFSAAGPATRARLAERAATRRLAPRQTLFLEGDPADAVYCVLEGRVSVCLQTIGGRELRLNTVGPGELLGEIAVLDGDARSASAVALEACAVAALRRADVLAAIEADAGLARQVIVRLCAELRRVSGRVADAGLLDTPAQLARRLLDRAEESADGSGEAAARITQEELAQSFGVSRVTVNKHLNAWRERGWVRLARNTIVIVSIDALVALIEERLDASDAPRA